MAIVLLYYKYYNRNKMLQVVLFRKCDYSSSPSKAAKKFLAYVSLSNILERSIDAADICLRFSGC